MPFTHLHLHTHYSLLDGLGKVDDVLDKVKELGMKAAAITDHGTMYGVPEFYEKAKERGLKPIIGCEFYLAPNGLEKKRPNIDSTRYHLILLAKNNQGYQNLMKLATEAHLRGYYYKPRIDIEILKKYHEGLIGSSACVQGEVPRLGSQGKYEEAKEAALKYQEILGKDNFYLEIQDLPGVPQQKKSNEALIKISKETGIPLIATADIHYVNPEDSAVQDILLCLQTKKLLDDPGRMNMTSDSYHIRTPEEMQKAFSHIPEALENTQKIVDACDVEIKFDQIILPKFQVPNGKTDNDYLRELCAEGLKKRYSNQSEITQVHNDRLEYEMGIIEKMGFSSYFLIVQDFVNWARSQGILVGPGRGSAAGSFVSYLTGITNLDPIKYDLLFERFLNPDRISMPDIDLDFADHRRDEVLQYCREKYGEDHVAQIITFGTMAARAAVKDAGRVMAMDYNYCDTLSKMIPMFTNLKDALENTPDLIQEYNTNANAKKIIDAAQRLEGVARHASVHACGVVITPEPLTNYTPLQHMSRKKGEEQVVVTQYAASSKSSYVEKIGLLKMDFLGLKNLTIIESALKIIEQTTGNKIDIEQISLEDEKTFQLLQQGGTTGVFQLESSGMKRYLKQLRPTVFEDVVAMVALYRPGPMEWIPDFIGGKHGTKRVTYLHPKLEPILKNTYGVAVYQEQVMQIARDIAGYTGGEADNLRKVMGKKIVEKIAKEKKSFIERSVKNGVDGALAEKIFSFIEPFAGYGFNRSHAACYAMIGYQTAFLKAHYPAQFLAALLNSDKDDTDRIAIDIEEARGQGVEVLPPSINESFQNFMVTEDKNSIRFGLEAIKGVGAHIAQEVIEERQKKGPFKDIFELVERIPDKDMNKKSLEALAMSGALDDIIERNQLVQNVESILDYSKKFKKNASSGQTSLFDSAPELTAKIPKAQLTDATAATKRERLSWEKKLLGLYVSDHPLRQYQDYFTAKATPINKLERVHINQVVTIGGIIEKAQKHVTRNNQIMYFVTIEDALGKMEILAFPKVVDQNPDIWQEEKVIIVKGKLSDKDGEFKLLADSATLVNDEELEKYKKEPTDADKLAIASDSFRRPTAPLPTPATAFSTVTPSASTKEPFQITLPAETSDDILNRLAKILSQAPDGDSTVFITSINQPAKKLQTPFNVRATEELKEQVNSIING